MFFPEMRTGRFVTLQCVDTHQLGEFQKIGNASGTFQGLIEVIAVPRHSYLVPELFSQFGDFFERFAQPLFVTRHPAFVPEKQAKLAMERIDRTSAIYGEEFFDPDVHVFLYSSKLR